MTQNPALGAFLRLYRQSLSLSQTDLATILGVTSATICDLEQGRKLASPRRALAIATALNLEETRVLELALTDLVHRERHDLKVVVSSGGGC